MEGYRVAEFTASFLTNCIILKDRRQHAASRTISQVQRCQVKKLRKKYGEKPTVQYFWRNNIIYWKIIHLI